MLRSKKTVTMLESFLLAVLTSRKEVTLYTLRRDFGLNPGGLVHALRALHENGLVSRSGGSGQSHAYQITQSGDETLRTQWKDVISNAQLDRDWTIRAVWLATAMDLFGAPEFLRSLAERMQQASGPKMSDRAAEDGATADHLYFDIRQTVLRHERRALANAINDLAVHIEEGLEP